MSFLSRCPTTGVDTFFGGGGGATTGLKRKCPRGYTETVMPVFFECKSLNYEKNDDVYHCRGVGVIVLRSVF